MNKILIALFTTLLSNMASQVIAETESDNVITITADYRNSQVAEVTSSISVLDEEIIQDAAQQHLEEVLNLIPNLNWAGGSSRPRYFQIRGIGERDQYEGAPNPSVALVIDDIDFSSMGMVATLFDIHQVEVLRGPQSARFGANALAGMIQISSRAPTPDTEVRSQLILADDNTQGVGLSVSGALGESGDVSGLVSINQYHADGFRNNRYLNRSDTNARDELSLRSKLHWQINEQWLWKVTALAADLDNGYDAWALDNSYQTLTDKPGLDTQKSQAIANRFEYQGRNSDLLLISTFAETDSRHQFDGDWGNPDYWGIYGPYDFTSDTERARDNNTQEIRWLSKPKQNPEEYDWVVGLYRQYLEENNQIRDFYNDSPYRSLDSNYDAETHALYGQLRYQITETTELSMSLRNERRNAHYSDNSSISFNPKDTMTGGDLTLRQIINDDSQWWLSLARGYKAGGFNISLSIPESRRQYQPEYLVNYEAGYQANWLDNRLNFAASIFHMARKEVQISTSQQLDPNDPLTFIYFIDNAAEGTNQGLELDSSWRLNDLWRVVFNLGYLDTSIDSIDGVDQSLVGREQAHAPKYNAALAFEYRNDGGWFGRLEWNTKASFFYSSSHDQKAPASQQWHLKLGYESNHWSYYLWGRNLTNERYTVRGFYFANEPPDWQNKNYTRLGDPRHLGLTVRYQY